MCLILVKEGASFNGGAGIFRLELGRDPYLSPAVSGGCLRNFAYFADDRELRKHARFVDPRISNLPSPRYGWLRLL